MTLQTLLEVLSDGEFHSGTELGNQLGVSRAAVWKQLKKLEQMGLPLTSVKSTGYRLEGGLDLLDEQRILASLEPRARNLLQAFRVEGVVSSTNDLVLSEAADSKPGLVVTAEQQTAGRGRRGRAWVSPYAANVYLSLMWRFEHGVASIQGMSLAAGVEVVSALGQLGVTGCSLKWPNDVLHENRKLAGVLIEITGDAAGPCDVVLGVGVNVNMAGAKTASIDQPWCDLQTLKSEPVSRNQVVAALINHLLPMMASFASQGFSAYRERWCALDAYAGDAVGLDMGGTVVEGVAAGVDEVGALLMRTADGVQAFQGGELTLRRM